MTKFFYCCFLILLAHAGFSQTLSIEKDFSGSWKPSYIELPQIFQYYLDSDSMALSPMALAQLNGSKDSADVMWEMRSGMKAFASWLLTIDAKGATSLETGPKEPKGLGTMTLTGVQGELLLKTEGHAAAEKFLLTREQQYLLFDNGPEDLNGRLIVRFVRK